MASANTGTSQTRPRIAKSAAPRLATRDDGQAQGVSLGHVQFPYGQAPNAHAIPISTRTPITQAKSTRVTKSASVQPIKFNQKQNVAKSYALHERLPLFGRRGGRNEDAWRDGPRIMSARSATSDRRSGFRQAIALDENVTYGLDWSKVENADLIGSDSIVLLADSYNQDGTRRAARKTSSHMGNPTVDGLAAAIPHRSSSPDSELMMALESLTLSTSRLQKSKHLPFLLRTLRRGFSARCHQLHVSTSPTQSTFGSRSQIKITYQKRSSGSFEGNMPGWFCPICNLFKAFPTRDMLDRHLDWDHKECTYNWGPVSEGSITIFIPEIDELESSNEEESSEEETDSSTSSNAGTASPTRSVTPDSTSPSTRRSQSPPFENLILQSRASMAFHTPEPERKPFIGDRSIVAPSPRAIIESYPRVSSPVMPERQSPPIPPGLRPATPEADPQIRKEAYPTPPPYGNLEGPACVDPKDLKTVILPANMYSARPGGAKLYDLLNELPMDDFGLMGWFVIDKEEEIFEQDDVRDEDKVMQALWARWIILHRNDFIADYFKSAKSFLNQYWKEIHRAAGFSALRVWLLVLVSHRYLKGVDLCNLLQHYKELVGMDKWK